MSKWIEKDLEDVLDCIESGLRPKGGASEDTGEIPSLGGENIVQSGGVSIRTLKKVPLTFFNSMSKGQLKLRWSRFAGQSKCLT